MAVKTFDEIYAQLSADERKVLDNVFAREPEFKGGWTRHDDYSRKTQELATERKNLETDLEYAQRMRAWADDEEHGYQALVRSGIISEDGEELWTSQKEELQRQLDAAKKAVGGDMDPAELDRRVREIVKDSGLALTQEQINNVYTSEGRKMAQEVFDENWKAKETDFNSKTIPMVAGFAAGTAVIASKWEKETGEQWTVERQKELFDMMGKEGNFDPFVIGEKMLEPVRAKKTEEARIEAEVQKRLTERGMPEGGDRSGRFIPTPGSPKGALEQALDREEGFGDFERMIKARSVEAAQELISEGKI